MGASSITKATPHLELEWADLDSHRSLSSLCTVQTLLLHPRISLKSLKSYELINFSIPKLQYGVNRNYSREIIDFTFGTKFLQKLGLRLSNQSEVVARRVGFVGSIAKESGVLIRDWSERPIRPCRSFLDVSHESIVSIVNNPDLCVREYEANWEVSIEFGDVRPQDEVWTTIPILIGAADSREIKLEGELRGDDLPRPIACTLNVNLEVEKRPMKKADVQQYMGCNQEQ